IAEWLTAGGRQPRQTALAAAPETSVSELILAYWRHAEHHYRYPGGMPTKELDNLKDALRPLKKLYGQMPAARFRPLALRAAPTEMTGAGLCRMPITARVNRIRRVFRWAASVELIPVTTVQALETVAGLQRGRCDTPEAKGIQPVPAEHIEAALPWMPRPVAAMVEL